MASGGFTANASVMGPLMATLQLGSNPSSAVQARVKANMEVLQSHVDYMPHLAVILSSPDVDRYVRQLAGISLKNFVRSSYGTTSPEARAHVKQLAVRCLADEVASVRRTAGVVIASVCAKEEGFARWPGLLEGLCRSLDAPQPAFADGALYCVSLLCEDLTRELEDHTSRPLNALVPALVRLLGRSDAARLRALTSLNAFVVDWPVAMKLNQEAFLGGVFACANSPDPMVCRQVCKTFATLCDVKPDAIHPFISSVATFMLAQTAKRDEPELQCEACEFWQVLAEQVMWHDCLRSRVRTLLPLLLDAMRHTPEDVATLLELDDASVPLPDRHVAPWFAKGRKARGGGGDRELESSDSDKAAVDPSFCWSLRKAAAAALDAVCGAFGDAILEVLMPLLQPRLASPKWMEVEVAVLALGACADGTINGLVPLLPQLIAGLLATLEAEPGQRHVLLVSIACWTFGRLSSWVVRHDGGALLDRSLRAFARLLTYGSRRVQEAACSGLTVVIDQSWRVSKLVQDFNALAGPAMLGLVSALTAAMARYQAKNLLLAYDLLVILLRHPPPQLLPSLAAVVWPALLRACTTTPPDRRLVALLDCVATVTAYLGPSVAPHAAALASTASRLGITQLQQAAERTGKETALLAQLRANRPELTSAEAQDVVLSTLGVSSYDTDFAIVALDICGSLCEALGPQSSVPLTNTPLSDLLREAVLCCDAQVRQAAFGLIGDIARVALPLVTPLGQVILPPLLDSLYGSNVSLCMNASWALGELCVRLPLPEAFVHEAIGRLRRVLMRDHDGSLLRNVAITLCRLAPFAKALVASTLAETAPYWLPPLSSVKPSNDRDKSHEAVLAVLRLNVPAALQHLPRLCALLHSWGDTPLPPAVRQQAVELFAALRAAPEWSSRWPHVPADAQLFVQRNLS